MRVAMIGLRAPEEGLGGIESALRALSPQLATRGVEVTLFCRRRYSNPAGGGLSGVSQVHLRAPRWRGGETLIYSSLATPLALLQGFDVLHFHAMGPAALSILPWMMKKPSVATLHGVDWARAKWGPMAREVLKLGERAAVTFPRRTIVVSRDLHRHCENLRPGQARFIPNGVDPSGPVPDGPPPLGLVSNGFFLALGRRVPEKGLLTLLQAFSQMDTSRRLVIAGAEGDSPSHDRVLLQEASRDPRVVFSGPVRGRDKEWLLHHATALALPSSLEGHPMALLEAMACRRPVVVSDLPVLKEMVGEGEDRRGLVVPVGDVQALARALSSLEANPREAEGMGQRGKELVERQFGWGRIADATVEVYREVLGR